MEIDAQERQDREKLIQKITRISYGKGEAASKEEQESRKKTAEITMKKLYDEAFELEEKQKNRVSRFQKRIEEKIMQKKITRKSESLINKRMNLGIMTIFKKLDSDNDGLICANKIDFSELEPIKLKIMTPVLLEMEQNDAVLDIKQFTYAIKKLCEVSLFYFPCLF